MEDRTDYKCYLLGCESAGVEPLEEWRFRLLQEQYLHQASSHELWERRSPVPEFVLERLASLVAEGYRIAAGGSADGEEPGAAAAGVREPRVPHEPMLSGSAARSLPSAESADTSFWRT